MAAAVFVWVLVPPLVVAALALAVLAAVVALVPPPALPAVLPPPGVAAGLSPQAQRPRHRRPRNKQVNDDFIRRAQSSKVTDLASQTRAKDSGGTGEPAIFLYFRENWRAH